MEITAINPKWVKAVPQMSPFLPALRGEGRVRTQVVGRVALVPA
jgi:hypothetical protein